MNQLKGMNQWVPGRVFRKKIFQQKQNSHHPLNVQVIYQFFFQKIFVYGVIFFVIQISFLELDDDDDDVDDDDDDDDIIEEPPAKKKKVEPQKSPVPDDPAAEVILNLKF